MTFENRDSEDEAADRSLGDAEPDLPTSASDRDVLDTCANCDAPLTGPYCAACGQANRDLNLGLRELLREGLGAFLSFDRRLLETLRLLVFVPGSLTAEFLAGRRRRFLPPFKLYLGVSLIGFLLMSATGSRMVDIRDTGTDGSAQETTVRAPVTISRGSSFDGTTPVTSREQEPAAATLAPEDLDRLRTVSDPEIAAAQSEETLKDRLGKKLERALEDPEDLDRRFRALLPKVIFCLVPVLAILTALVTRRRHPFAHHLVFSLHAHSLGFVIVTVSGVVELAAGETVGDWIGALGLLWALLWLARGMGRVFEIGRWRRILGSAAISAAYLVAVLAGLVSGLVLLILAS